MCFCNSWTIILTMLQMKCSCYNWTLCKNNLWRRVIGSLCIGFFWRANHSDQNLRTDAGRSFIFFLQILASTCTAWGNGVVCIRILLLHLTWTLMLRLNGLIARQHCLTPNYSFLFVGSLVRYINYVYNVIYCCCITHNSFLLFNQ